ncbi:MAG: hypothetical protein KA149_01920 [Chitinophagales bacterium]|nr:hypothetical protein [Chitinophagales bacterium]
MSDISIYEKRVRYTEALNSISEIRSHVLYKDVIDSRYTEILNDALEIVEMKSVDAKAKAFTYGFHSGGDSPRSAALELSTAIKNYFKDNSQGFKRFKKQVTDQVFLQQTPLIRDEVLIGDCESIVKLLLTEIQNIRAASPSI